MENNIEQYKIEHIEFEYPQAYDKLVELNLVNFEIWFIMERRQATAIYNGMKKRYPKRDLIPFAKRANNDDTACFEIGREKSIQIIHDFASEGYEQRESYNNIWEWTESAVKTMISYLKDEGID